MVESHIGRSADNFGRSANVLHYVEINVFCARVCYSITNLVFSCASNAKSKHQQQQKHVLITMGSSGGRCDGKNATLRLAAHYNYIIFIPTKLLV
jgi:hypothetical protein